MQPPPIPDNEQERLAALRKLVVLDTPPTEALDQLTRTCARMLRVPITLVSLIDEKRQWFKSRVGLEVSESPRDVSFCGHVVATNSPLVVQDTLIDARFHDNPFATGELGLRAYLGVPVHSPEGMPIGTLCAVDRRPRAFSPAEIEAMVRMGQLVSRMLAAGAPAPPPGDPAP